MAALFADDRRRLAIVWGDLLPAVLPFDDHLETTHQLTLAPVPKAASQARDFVRAHAPDLPDDTASSLELLTSELVTNAVLHARTPIELGIAVAEQSLIIAVHDLDLARPKQEFYPDREGGWGLRLVRALADSGAFQTHAHGGKTAWFRLLRAAGAPVPDDAAQREDASGRDTAASLSSGCVQAATTMRSVSCRPRRPA